MAYTLINPSAAQRLVAQLFSNNPQEPHRIEITEDRCFTAGQTLSLGLVSLKPEREELGSLLHAVRKGSFEWQIPSATEVKARAIDLLEMREPAGSSPTKARDAYLRSVDRVSRALDSTACIGLRVGLFHPCIDASVIEEMPFGRATTIIADTSGVIQGGLDFIARFLHPIARIKVPAIVHMEIVNQADRFLKHRRSTRPNRSAALLDHVLSQGGQRVLLRLEQRPDTEIERTAVFSDPLRNAFHADRDEDWSDLNLSVPLRSYCDRLIVEAARQHQALSSPGHPVFLLTSDQGLARMALAEGITPLFFRSIGAKDFFGRLFAGVNFDPFTGGLRHVSLTHILWELAATFGYAKLSSNDGSRALEIAAIGEELAWAPFHSRDDLLWLRTIGFETAPNGDMKPTVPGTWPSDGRLAEMDARGGREVSVSATLPERPQLGFYRFNINSMLGLIARLADQMRITERDAARTVGASDRSSASEYRKFLSSGGLITIEEGNWTATDRLISFYAALRSLDYAEILRLLNMTPSFQRFFGLLSERGAFRTGTELPFTTRAASTYQILAEVSCVGATIAGEGFFATLVNPPPEDFVNIAVLRFRDVANGERLAPVGAWLESLIRESGIHPINARGRLHEASAAGLLRFTTEGSTTDTRHDEHAIRVLQVQRGKPVLGVVHLYRGDFLIPNKSSVSLGLEDLRS
jgi:hypothetical protein